MNFRDLPSAEEGFSPLYLDYIDRFESVRPFYSADFRSDESWQRMLDGVASRAVPRSEVARILSMQNRAFHCGVKTLANIDLLLNDTTVAVVTGQQVGIFTGPMYTLYKTLTALKLVDHLSQRFPDYSFVPVFWLAGEDHDYEEVTSVGLINRSNDFQLLHYGERDPSSPAPRGAVGVMEFDERMEAFLSGLEQAISQTEFTPGVMGLLRTAYQRGMTFNKAFVHLMNDLLEDSGLVFLDPNDVELKRLLSPIFLREIEQTPRMSQLVISRSAELEKAYHAQVKPRAVNLFLFHQNGRFPIEPRPNGFGLKGARQQFTRDELVAMAGQTPERFSPNVVLRPICQDTLLPTITYVGGPAEIAYFAQLGTLYHEFGLPQPIVYPRASATILEEKVQKVLERYNLQDSDFFQEVELLKRKVAGGLSTVNLDELFGGTRAAISDAFQALGGALEQIDKTLVGSVDTAAKKTEYHLDSIRQKVAAAEVRRHEASVRQIEKAAAHVFPRSRFQERELNVVHFLNRYGLEFLRWLRGELVIDRFKHQLIRM